MPGIVSDSPVKPPVGFAAECSQVRRKTGRFDQRRLHHYSSGGLVAKERHVFLLGICRTSFLGLILIGNFFRRHPLTARGPIPSRCQANQPTSIPTPPSTTVQHHLRYHTTNSPPTITHPIKLQYSKKETNDRPART